MGEVAVCKPLWDPRGTLEKLKSEARLFPPALQRSLIERFLWEAGFSLRIAEKGIMRGDFAYVAGCCFRSCMCVLQTLFALNEEYWLNEKGALELASRFALVPHDLKPRMESVWSHIYSGSSSLQTATDVLAGVVQETDELLQCQALRQTGPEQGLSELKGEE
jgi:hypothetical protein